MSRAPDLTLDYRLDPGLLDPGLPLARRELSAFLAEVMAGLELTGTRLSLTLLDDAGIAAMNAKYLNCQGPTNILSFPEEDPERPEELGALFLSVETLCREVFLYGQEPRQHLARLLAHGILHLAGHEHGPLMDQLTEQAVVYACPVPLERFC